MPKRLSQEVVGCPGFEKESCNMHQKVTESFPKFYQVTKMNHHCCWPFFYEGNEQYCVWIHTSIFLDSKLKLSC